MLKLSIIVERLTGKKGIHPFNINHTKLKLSLNEYKISLKSIQSVQPVQWHTIHLPYLKFLSHLDRHLTNQRIHCTNAITKKIYPLFNFIISSTLSHHKFSEETHRCPRFEDLTKLSSLSLSLSLLINVHNCMINEPLISSRFIKRRVIWNGPLDDT